MLGFSAVRAHDSTAYVGLYAGGSGKVRRASQGILLYEYFDEIVKSVSCMMFHLLSDGMRPAIADANDEAQLGELETLGELTKRAWEQDAGDD